MLCLVFPCVLKYRTEVQRRKLKNRFSERNSVLKDPLYKNSVPIYFLGSLEFYKNNFKYHIVYKLYYDFTLLLINRVSETQFNKFTWMWSFRNMSSAWIYTNSIHTHNTYSFFFICRDWKKVENIDYWLMMTRLLI